MTSLRTAADILEEYNTVRTAYLKAVKLKEYGRGDVSAKNQEIDKLRREMEKLGKEYSRKTSGGIKVYRVEPTDA